MLYEKSVGVVVPAYNEAQFIGDVIETMPPFVDRIYVIDDASTDKTWQEILKHSGRVGRKEYEQSETQDAANRVIPIQHDENRGVGGAIKTGYKQALADEMDVTAVMGGDGQMDPDYLANLIRPVVGGYAEYTKADRLYGDGSTRGMSRWRLFGNTVLSWLTRITSGYWGLSDPQNGYTVISLPALEALDLEEMYEYYGYCNDLLVKLNVLGMRVADVPVPAVYGDETSSIRYPEYIVKVSGMLFRNFIWRLRREYVEQRLHPLVVCYLLSPVLLVLGLVLAIGGSERLQYSLLSAVFGIGLLITAIELDKRANERLWVSIDA